MGPSLPDDLSLERHRDWQGRAYERWLPQVLFGLICLIPLFALFNVFGQNPTTNTVANPNGVARLTVRAPESVRSGLLFEARFDIAAKREIKDAVLVLDRGWNDSMTMNTIEPGASSETSH